MEFLLQHQFLEIIKMKGIIQYIVSSSIGPILIFLIGLFFAFIISLSSPKPQKGFELPKPTPVFYEVVTKKNITLKILTNGEVKPLNEINLISQVSGQIVEAADEFVDGGIIKADSPLVWIDDRDYKLAVISAESRVAQASKLLEREIAERLKAERVFSRTLVEETGNAINLQLTPPEACTEFYVSPGCSR